MSYGWWFLVILITAFTVIFGIGWLLKWVSDRIDRLNARLDRLADPAPLPGELPTAGYFELPREFGQPFDLPGVLFEVGGGPYGPFPANTGPLLILSEKDAANAALEREIRLRCAEAEAKIPPRWR